MKASRAPLSSGPWKVAQWTPEERLVLEPNERWSGQAPYLDRVITRLTLPGAIYLTAIAEMPNITFQYLPETNVFFFALGGTSILIIVGVALDTIRQMEAQLMMRSYEGFLR